jgi:hypothetical protein
MRLMAFAVGCFLLITIAARAQQDEVKPEKMVGWMRVVNTLEAEYKMFHSRFADADELLAFARSGKQTGSAVAFEKQLAPFAIQPYILRVVTSADGNRYFAAIRFPSDMHNEATWCKTEAFSDDSALISLGQNIQCAGANALGASSKPMK